VEYLAQPLPPTDATEAMAAQRLVAGLRSGAVLAWGRIGDAVWREPIPADRWREPLTIRNNAMEPDDTADMQSFLRLYKGLAELYRDIEVSRAQVEAMRASIAVFESPSGAFPDPKRYRFLNSWCITEPAEAEARRRCRERADPPTEKDVCEELAAIWNAAGRKATTGASVAAIRRGLRHKPRRGQPKI
jgi:hypothetical protein